VESVDRIDAPLGEESGSWYRYVLKSRSSTITGQRCGTRAYVREYAAQCAEQLNERAASCNSYWAPRGRKPVNPR